LRININNKRLKEEGMQNSFQKCLMMLQSGHHAAAALSQAGAFPNCQGTVKYFSAQNLSSGGAGAGKKLDLKAMTMNLTKPNQTLPFKANHEYDCIVIGGGTGGLSFA
jgi:hypothetical protein